MQTVDSQLLIPGEGRLQIPILESLSLREKIGLTCQALGADYSGLEEDGLMKAFFDEPVGSLFVGSEIIGNGGPGFEQLRAAIAKFQSASRIPLSIAGDLENGAGGAVPGLTAFPNLLALGAVDDEELAYEYGKWTAAEAVAVGFNWTFGPVVDLIRNWLNPVVSIRSLGQNPDRVGVLACALIRGCQDHGLSATAKHFPGDGVDFRDQHLCVSVNSLSKTAWWESFGAVFKKCVDAGVHSIMAGHIGLPWFDRSLSSNGSPMPASTSQKILTDLLRNELGYEGVIVSDALIMAGYCGASTRSNELIIESFNAGIDVMLWP